MKKDYYHTLGVQRHATEGEIKSAYKRLAREHHPDVTNDAVASGALFPEINEAYEILGDPLKRKAYDDAQSSAIVMDLRADAQGVVDEYFQQFHTQPNT